jgi:hypothetical protein
VWRVSLLSELDLADNHSAELGLNIFVGEASMLTCHDKSTLVINNTTSGSAVCRVAERANKASRDADKIMTVISWADENRATVANNTLEALFKKYPPSAGGGALAASPLLKFPPGYNADVPDKMKPGGCIRKFAMLYTKVTHQTECMLLTHRLTRSSVISQ